MINQLVHNIKFIIIHYKMKLKINLNNSLMVYIFLKEKCVVFVL